MKRAGLLLMLCMTLLVSCSKSDENCAETESLTGTWKLVETLADPGDGSGIWQPVVTSSQTLISFGTNGTIEGNAFPQARHYEVLSDTTVKFTFADGTFIIYNYAPTETTLVLSGGGCIEACGAKFIKITGSRQ